MDLAIVVYLIGLAASLKSVAVAVMIFTFSSILFAFIIGYAEDNLHKIKPPLLKTLKWLIIPSIVLLTIVPSKTDMYIMTGLVVGEKVITSEKGNELLDKSYLLLVSKIEKTIEETTERDKK